MDTKLIERLAEQTGAEWWDGGRAYRRDSGWEFKAGQLAAFAALIAEECAKTVEQYARTHDWERDLYMAADSIRSKFSKG
jgi:hypothetical protein